MSASATAWLASYPKSGNTWVRAQLDSLLNRGEPDLNHLDRSSSGDRLDPALGVPLGDLDDGEQAAILRLSWAVGRRPGRFVLRKTHRAWVPAADGWPIVWQPEGACVVHIVRDPRAVVASWAHHLGVSLEEAASVMASDRLSMWRSDAHGDEDFTSWSRHATSWLDECTLPRLLVRYEDMLDDPAVELGRMSDFLGLEAAEEDIDRAVAACSFASMAATEIVSGFREAAAPGRAFFRRGEAQAWREELPAGLQDRIVRDHGPVMERLGYLT